MCAPSAAHPFNYPHERQTSNSAHLYANTRALQTSKPKGGASGTGEGGVVFLKAPLLLKSTRDP